MEWFPRNLYLFRFFVFDFVFASWDEWEEPFTWSWRQRNPILKPTHFCQQQNNGKNTHYLLVSVSCSWCNLWWWSMMMILLCCSIHCLDLIFISFVLVFSFFLQPCTKMESYLFTTIAVLPFILYSTHTVCLACFLAIVVLSPH